MTLYRQNRAKVRIANATITAISGAHDEIIAPASGYSISLVQMIASNQLNAIYNVVLYDGLEPITPLIPLGASGTMILDEIGGEQLELTVSSGLYGSSSYACNTQVTVYYVLHDERTPTSKNTARFASMVPIGRASAIRMPNIVGEQSEG